MKNQEIAKIFYGIADYLEIDRTAFKPFAYRRAALALESLEEDIENIYERGGLKEVEKIPGVGKSLGKKIEEYLKTGKILYYEQFKRRLPLNLEEIIKVEGLGPRKAHFLYQKLGVANLKDLEKAAKADKISSLFGFGKKTQENILQGIEFVKRSKGRFLLNEIMPKAKEICDRLKEIKEVKRVDVAGSLRRMKETIGDVDFLVIIKGLQGSSSTKSSAEKILNFFVSRPNVIKVWGKGSTKASVRVAEGFDMDLRVVPEKSYGSALQYFTGSVEHNIAVRRIAQDMGLKLSEYGLFQGPKMINAETEEEIYKILGMAWIPPELRENQGEIKAAQENQLPELINLRDIKGDLHCHSNWDGGDNSIEDLAKTAQGLGYEYLGISDHTKFLRIERGLDEKKLERRNKEIDKINAKYKIQNKNFRVLKGCEANILNDGRLDIKDEALAKLDYVIAGIHSNLKMAKGKMTERMLAAIKNPHVDIISHPTGRLIKKRDEYQIDLRKIMKAAKEYGKILEINGCPERLDLNDKNIRMAKELAVKMIINADTHRKNQMKFMEYGVSQARRGWAEKKDIVNCWPLEKLLKYFE